MMAGPHRRSKRLKEFARAALRTEAHGPRPNAFFSENINIESFTLGDAHDDS